LHETKLLFDTTIFFEYLLWGKTPQPILFEKEKVQQNTKH